MFVYYVCDTVHHHNRTSPRNNKPPHTATNKSRPALLSYDPICRPSKIGKPLVIKLNLFLIGSFSINVCIIKFY